MATTASSLGSMLIKHLAGQITSTMKSAFKMLNVATDGTQEATKFITTDSNTNQGVAKVTGLYIGSGSGTQVDALGKEINQAFDVSNKGEILITTKALDDEDNGKIFFLDLSSGFTTTLPALASVDPGWQCRIIVKTAPSTSYILVVHGDDSGDMVTSNIIELEVDDANNAPTNSGHGTLTFVSGSSLSKVGDWIQIETNSSKWFIHGQTKLDGGIALS